MPAIRLDHARLDVSDIEAAERFYRDALGLRRIVEYVRDTHRILQMGPDGRPPGVELWHEPGLVPAPSTTQHIAFRTDHVEKVVARVGELGYPVIRRPFVVDWETVAFVTDPDGHLIELNNFVGRPIAGRP